MASPNDKLRLWRVTLPFGAAQSRAFMTAIPGRRFGATWARWESTWNARHYSGAERMRLDRLGDVVWPLLPRFATLCNAALLIAIVAAFAAALSFARLFLPSAPPGFVFAVVLAICLPVAPVLRARVAEYVARGAGVDLDRLTAGEHALAANARRLYLRWGSGAAAVLILVYGWNAWWVPPGQQMQPLELAVAMWMSFAALSLLTVCGWRRSERSRKQG